MKFNLIHIKLRDKNKVNLNRILELFNLSAENRAFNLNYPLNIKEYLNHNLEISYDKKYIKKNIGKMIYRETEDKEIKIFNEKFVANNINRAKMIINNKQYNLKEIIENQKQYFKIEIKFLDNIIKLNSMFSNCKLLNSINNFKNLNTKNLKTIFELFAGCDSLLIIDDISNWNINKINNISKIFSECSKLKELPDISRWDLSNAKDISGMFEKCSSLEYLPEISKWDTKNVINMSCLFHDCSLIRYLPDISKWNTTKVEDIHEIFYKCSHLESIPDISN